MELIGPVSAELFVRSSTPYVDVVVRVCDVHPDGRSLNVCEGVRRLGPGSADIQERTGEDVRRVLVDLWPVGHRFARGHRIRVHVAAGRTRRSPAIRAPAGRSGAAGTMVPADVEVFHSPEHPSAVLLPVLPCAPRD